MVPPIAPQRREKPTTGKVGVSSAMDEAAPRKKKLPPQRSAPVKQERTSAGEIGVVEARSQVEEKLKGSADRARLAEALKKKLQTKK